MTCARWRFGDRMGMDALMRLFFEDFTAGQALPGAETQVSPDDAGRYAALFGALAPASPETAGVGAVPGLYVSALCMRLIFEAFLYRTASLGAPGIEAVDWPHPALAGDRLRLSGAVTTTRASRSRPDMGLVGFDFALRNQHDDCVMTQSNVILVQRRTPRGEA